MEQKKYWKGLEELNDTKGHQEIVKNEFQEDLPFAEGESLLNATTPRRDFLKYLGFTTAAATIAASCEIPVKKAIPYVNKPEEITPGVPNYYASTYAIDGEYVPVVVKTREGRPIKIEGNTLSSVTGGSTTARVQGAVLSLYDTARLRYPTINGTETTWAELDKQVSAALNGLGGRPVVVLSSTILSPSTKKLIGEFLSKYPGSRHVTYDAVSYSGMLLANEAAYGKRALPSYHFENAKVVVSLAADFLGTWLSPAEFSKQYGATRKINAEKPEMSKHFHFESMMSLTGANADERYTHKPSETGAVALALYNALSGGTVSGIADKRLAEGIQKAAKALQANQGKALVVAGSNDVNVQLIVNAINNLVGANGTTIDWATTSNYRQGIDSDMAQLVNDLNAGSIGALLINGVNPVYDYFDGKKFVDGLKKAALTITFNDRKDETSELCKYAAPDHHFLESWNDAEGKTGYYSFTQPTIAPLFKTRAFQDSLLVWGGNSTSNWVDYLKGEWMTRLGGQEAWDKALQDGVIEPATAPALAGAAFAGDVAAATAKISSAKKGGKHELVLYEKVAIGNGKMANNPWLQEMPDPITRATWDNYACVSNKLAQQYGMELGDDYEINAGKKVLKIKANGKEIALPLLIVPGMHPDVIAIAVGYGRNKNAGKAAGEVGKNAYPLVSYNGQTFDYFAPDVTVEATGEKYDIGMTQTHNSYEGRPIIKETTLEEFIRHPKAVNEDREELAKYGKDFRADATLYPDYPYPGIKWGMSIDLNTCFGCGACTIACQAENNVSVVGKEEVIKAHEMHWIRIDRYFSGDVDNPEVVFQPMLCQHCDNAPCENVCPVAATMHSSEGINQMAYNRCIGTRYCANNCPYKVRRFNWRDWNGADSFENNLYDVSDMNDNLTRMVLNPDVVVRSRGVMEKCSFCVQRLQDAKLAAKKEGRPVKDGEAKTACQQACAADAIVFGNVNDKESRIARIRNEEQKERLYYVLEEIHTLPSVNYLAKIRNKDAAPKAAAGHHEEAHHG
ncbi:TAT-variant-translocated molybdopterin oxidoreductase [Chitinophaga japonensis]|uniref:Molybdopterin-containing oxidoreductase family iron-sulfur binding subunit n=1 Tax=Chitinophaga japonensis TaxID=104662 RepID=A0A562TE21_CHIJA|nr:TAT-variant-translocated molybdopterin oxidoreductase [Chitinophaga japonensis]TWI91504.1 molybdopterin-containing oxidoreductase family iron-sulfur binding subunit [Chitinophaga japonensis]